MSKQNDYGLSIRAEAAKEMIKWTDIFDTV